MGRKILLLSLVAVCGLAIGCGVPTSSETASDNLEEYVPTSSETASDNLESYWVSSAKQWMMLRTIGSWEGGDWDGGEYDIFVKIDEVPWVINAGYTQVDVPLSLSSFNVFVQPRDLFEEGSPWAYSLKPYGPILEGVFGETGEYVIRVVAYGSTWWVKVGVEP